MNHDDKVKAALQAAISDAQADLEHYRDNGFKNLALTAMGRKAGLQKALRLIQPHVTIKKTAWGDFRVPGTDSSDDTAYFTDDLQDAIDTAHAMYPTSTIKFNGKEV